MYLCWICLSLQLVSVDGIDSIYFPHLQTSRLCWAGRSLILIDWWSQRSMRTRFVRNLKRLKQTSAHTLLLHPMAWNHELSISMQMEIQTSQPDPCFFSGHQYGVKILFVTQHTTAILLKGRSARSKRLSFRSRLKDYAYTVVSGPSILFLLLPRTVAF